MSIEPHAVYTVGYGNRPVETLMSLLGDYEITHVADVRSHPYSRSQPSYSRDELSSHLQERGIEYVFLGEQLGGRPDDPSCYTNGKVDYVKCQDREPYREGIRRLRTAVGRGFKVVLLCSELKPQNCHRSKLIGETLLREGIEVRHIDEQAHLRSQGEVIQDLTGGQQALFGEHDLRFMSSKKYR
jgi:uncharacterized protein (DUF488 family)